MARKKIWMSPQALPHGVADIYEWRTTDGAIRQGTHIQPDIHKDDMVLIELKMASGSSTLFRKRDVIATFVRGLPPRPFCCPYCGTRIKYESVGRMDRDNWPVHVKWLPKNLYHGTHCLEAIMQEIPKQGATYAHGIYTDACGNAISDPDPIGPPGEWITVGGTKVSTGRKKARCVDNYEEY